MSGVVTASEAANIRAARDQAWVEHRGVLDESSADRFEDLLRQDDLATNACFMQVNELAELRQGLQAAAVINADINSAREALGRAKSDLERIEGEIAETVARLFPGSPLGLSIEQLEAWLAARENVLLAYAEFCSSEGDLKRTLRMGRLRASA